MNFKIFGKIFLAFIFLLSIIYPLTGLETIKSETFSLKCVGGDSQVYLGWEKVKGADGGYYIYRGPGPGLEYTTPLTDFPVLQTSYTDFNVENGKKYCYYVVALDKNLKIIAKSNECCAEPSKDKPPVIIQDKCVLKYQIGNKEYFVNGNSKFMDTAPVIVENRTFLVIRYVVEEIGGSISWDGKEKKVTIVVKICDGEKIQIQLQIGSPTLRVNGVEKPIDPNNPKVVPFIKDGRTMLPLRAIGENLKTEDIKWYAATQEVVLIFSCPLCGETKETISISGKVKEVYCGNNYIILIDEKGTSWIIRFPDSLLKLCNDLKVGDCIIAYGKRETGAANTLVVEKIERIECPEGEKELVFDSNCAKIIPAIDGRIAKSEWDDASIIKFYGITEAFTLFAKNDKDFLYILLDVHSDTGKDGLSGDYFWFTFDFNKDRKITPKVDVNYGIIPEGLCYQNYLGPSTWTGCSIKDSKMGAGFGPSLSTEISHTLYEFSYKLTEIGGASLDYVLSGLKVKSANPAFDIDIPKNFYQDFSNLFRIKLCKSVYEPGEIEGKIIELYCDKGYMVIIDEKGIKWFVKIPENLTGLCREFKVSDCVEVYGKIDKDNLIVYLEKIERIECPSEEFESNCAKIIPTIDGRIAKGEWDDASIIKFKETTYLTVFAKNDKNYLYILLDIHQDTTNDPPSEDYFWFTFDYDKDKKITPKVDVNYGILITGQSPPELCYQNYLGPSTWTGCSIKDSKMGIGFSSTPSTATSHRFYEFGFKLSEIGAEKMDYTYFGLKARSKNPSFDIDLPKDFYKNFSGLYKLKLCKTTFGETEYKSSCSKTTPKIDGFVNKGEWDDANLIKFDETPKVVIYAKNDSRYLYILLDFHVDTVDDGYKEDYFWFTFDFNKDRKITANLDVNYGIYTPPGANIPALCYQNYLGSATWTGCSIKNSRMGAGFGETLMSSTKHRFYEFAFDLSEIGGTSLDYVLFGFRVRSKSFDLTLDLPSNFFNDFTNLYKLYLCKIKRN